jgi:hypothetical protein
VRLELDVLLFHSRTSLMIISSLLDSIMCLNVQVAFEAISEYFSGAGVGGIVQCVHFVMFQEVTLSG